MSTLWRYSTQQARDLNGRAFAAAKAFFFDSSTNTPRVVFQDNDQSTPHAHPVVADAQGRFPAVFLPAGLYREMVTTSGGVLIWDVDDIDATPTIIIDDGGGGGSVLGYETGDVIWRPTAGTKTGFVRLNGRTIGNPASGALERANNDTLNLFTYLWNGLTNTEAPVSGGRGASASADFAANKTLTLPSGRLASLMGLADMGNSTVAIDPAATVPGAGIVPGSSIGAQVHTVTLAQSPVHDHDGVPNQAIVPRTGWGAGSAGAPGGGVGTIPEGQLVTGSGIPEASEILESLRVSANDKTLDLIGNEDTGSVGGGEAHNNMAPGLLGTFLIAL